MENNIKNIIDKINSKTDEEKAALPATYEFEMGDKSSVKETEEAVEEKNEQEKAFEPEVIPETRDVFAAAAAEARYDTPSTIFTAYVPRFTEVSENFRMVDANRQKNGASDRSSGREEDFDNKASSEQPIDPTAEFDEKNTDAVIVNMSTPTPDEDADRLNVFKFNEEEIASESKPERTVEDEREEIKRLITPEQPIEEEIPEEPEEVIPEEPKPKEPKSYTLPDPDSGINVVDFDEAVQSSPPAPDGVSEYIPDKKKRFSQEFELPIQRDRIKDRFLDAIMAARIRFGSVCFFALFILAYELSVFYDFFELSKLAVFTFSGTYQIIDLLLSASVLLLAIPEVISAFRALGKKKLVSDIAVPTAFAVIFLYTVGIIFSKRFTYPLYGFLFVLFALFSVYGTLCKLNADFAAFKVISITGEKQILEKKPTRSLPEENYALDGLVDEYKSRTARIFRAAFITDFFKRTSAVSESSSHTGLLLSMSAFLALIVSAICFFIVDGAYAAFSSFALVFLLGLPVFAVISHKLPYKHAEEYAVSEDSAALGENAYLEFSEIDVICFEDTEIFGIDDVNLKRFMLYGDRDNMENVMQKMCSLFSVVGGPLYSIFAGALDNRVRHNPAVNTVIEEDGLSGEVSDRLIYAGSEEYMLRHGIAIPEGASAGDRKNDTTKIMYAAEGKEVYAKFYIRYSFSEEFTMLLPSLKEQGIIPLIYTSDPNLSNELLHRLTAGADSLRVMKRFTPGTTDGKLHNRVSASMITVGDKVGAINLVLLSKKYKRFTERLCTSELTAMGIGIGVGAVLSFLGIFEIPMAVFGLWHLLWCAVLAFSSKNKFLKEKKALEKQNKN